MDATSATNGCAHYVPVIRGSSNIRGRLRSRTIRNKASRLSGACHYRRMIKSIIDAKHARRRSSNRTSNHRRVLIGIDRERAVGCTYVSRIDEKSGVNTRERERIQSHANFNLRCSNSPSHSLPLSLSLSPFLSAMLIISSLYVPLFRFCCSVTLGFSRYIALINVKKVYDNCCCKKSTMYDLAVVLNLPQLRKITFLLSKKHTWLRLLGYIFWNKKLLRL